MCVLVSICYLRKYMYVKGASFGCLCICHRFSLTNKGVAISTWWRHQMETFSALLASCVGNSTVPGEFHAQRPVTRAFDVFFDLCLNKRLSKQSWGWWCDTLSRPLWRHCNADVVLCQNFYESIFTKYLRKSVTLKKRSSFPHRL